MWDEFRKKCLLWLYYHSPILLLGFSYDAYMMRIWCSYVKVFGLRFKVEGLRFTDLSVTGEVCWLRSPHKP